MLPILDTWRLIRAGNRLTTLGAGTPRTQSDARRKQQVEVAGRAHTH